MTELELEYEELKHRYKKAAAYFADEYPDDTETNQLKAEKSFKILKARMEEVWEMIGKKALVLMNWQTVDQWIQQIGSVEFWTAKSVEYMKKSKKVVVRLERPQYWKEPFTQVND